MSPISTKFVFSPHCIAVGMFEGPDPGTEEMELKIQDLELHLEQLKTAEEYTSFGCDHEEEIAQLQVSA